MPSLVAIPPTLPTGPGPIPELLLSLADPPRIHWIGVGTHGPGDPRWRLPGSWCLHLYDYEATLHLDGQLLAIHPGAAGVSPAGADLHYHYHAPSTHACVHFQPAPGRADRVIPAMQDLGSGYRRADHDLREAVAWHASEPRRAEARVWDLLWGLSRAARAAPHPLIERARREIELRLGEDLGVGALARVLGVSHNHLTRLFRSQLGTTPVAWVRHRRASRARHLLTHTSMAIAAVAAEVGIRDPHHFNKLMRRELGASPRELRQRG
jgi:AraC family transcriptional regulator